MTNQTAIIIGAGPAGLTAAYELVQRTDIKPVVYEATGAIGGISRTINYKGNRMDIGGHRFFSKSDRVMQWWRNILPMQGKPARDDILLGRDTSFLSGNGSVDPEKIDEVMLIRNRLSRILFERRFYDYPISLSIDTFRNLGLGRIVKIALSYGKAHLLPIKNEESLEDFFVNRFGKELYLTFFKDYTEKVWGVGCDKIRPEWGAQRIKGLSITGAIAHAAKKMLGRNESVAQKGTETTLIERFFYPKFGPGQLWEAVAAIICEKGGEVHLRHKVTGLKLQGKTIIEAQIQDQSSGSTITKTGQYFFSTMPVKDLIGAFDSDVPVKVKQVADGLVYRDFITVGLLLKKLKIQNRTKLKTINNIIPDNWIYIQEPDVKLGRLQIFNNWSPYMVKDPDTVWMGLEYFCNENDELWNKPDTEFAEFGADELAQIGIIEKADVLDSVVVRVPKTYPAYFGSYDQFNVIRAFVDTIENLFLVGRNGMHRYNNQDHSMLAAMTAVDNIVEGVKFKNNIWAINTEDEYHEEK
jgi:protoporphyrinogen oxidase